MSDPQQITEFEWHVPEAGFECTRSAKNRFWLLVQVDDGRIEGDPNPGRTTTPLTQEPDLYLRFAALDPKRAAIQGFANDFGLLVGSRVTTQKGTSPVGDRISMWKKEITAMKQTLDVWEAVHTRRYRDLPELIGTRSVGEGQEISRGVLARLDRMLEMAGELDQTGSTRPKEHDEIAEALDFILGECNKRLNEHTAFRLLYNPEAELPTTLNNQPARMGRLEQRATPKNLLGALWLQVAEAIGRGTEHRQCAGCGRWLAISGDGRPRQSNFCGGACKAKRHRAKRRRARVLHADGVDVQEIARLLGTRLDHAELWIKGEGRIRNR